MKKHKMMPIKLLMIISLAVTPFSVRSETCQENLKEAVKVIKKCDYALEAKQEELDKLKLTFDEQQKYASQSQRMLNDANEKLESPLRNPLFMGSLGIVTGVILTIIFVK